MADEGRTRRLVRVVDRAFLSVFMAVVALILDRRLRKALRPDKDEKSAEVR